MSDDVKLRVNGQDFAGWKTAKVSVGLETIAGTFELSAAERWASDGKAWPIDPEDECEILLGDDRLISGYVDVRSPAFDENGDTLTIKGRDKSAAIVDCSADLGAWEFVNVNVVDLAKKICQPHGLEVLFQPGLTFAPVKKLAVEPGDTGFTVLEHACRLAGVLPIPGDGGQIVLTRAGTDRAPTDLIEGVNVKGMSGEFDASGRFATYKILGQHASSPGFFGEQAAHVFASATDPNVKRKSRTLIVRPEGGVTLDYAKRRVQWEANVRAARADTVNVTVSGWRMGDGRLWPVNALVHVKSKRLRVDGEMLITQTAFSVDDKSGKTTALTLRRPDAFKPEPIVQSDVLWKEIDPIR